MRGDGDAVREVTGVPAADILRRVSDRRRGAMLAARAPAPETLPPLHIEMPVLPERAAWRLVDLRGGSDAEFVAAAHLALLGRPPYDAELARRVREISGGRTRLGIIARLALSREGRGGARPRVAGIALPALVRMARSVDRVPQLSALLSRASGSGQVTPRAGGGGTPAPVADGAGGVRRAYGAVRRVPLLGGIAETLVVLARLRALQREVRELRAEVEKLKADRR